MPCDRSAIYLWSTRRGAYLPVAHFGMPAHVVERVRGERREARDVLRDELETADLVYLSRDRPLTPSQERLLEDADAFALALAPLRSAGRLLGCLVVGFDAPAPSEGALAITRGVARQAATLIDNALLFRRVQKGGELRARVAALAAAVGSENDTTRIGRLVCAEGAALFGVNTSVLLLREGDFLVARGAIPAGSPGETLRVPLAATDLPLVRAFRAGQPLFVNDVGDPAPEARLARQFGLKCHLTIPLVGRSGTIGCVVFADTRAAYRFALEAVDEARLLGAIATSALERAHLFGELVETNRALQRSEEHFRSLVELGSDIISILDADGIIRYESPSVCRALGHAPEDLVGRSPLGFIHPDDRALVQAALTADSGAGTPDLVEFRFLHKDGSWRVLEGSGKRTPGIGLIVSSRDVTARRRAEEALREEAEISAALARVGQVLISSLDAPVVLERLSRVTAEVLDCLHSTTWLWRPDEDAFVPIAGYVNPPELWDSLRLLHLPRALIGRFLEQIESDDLVELSADRESGLLSEMLAYYETPTVLCMGLRRGDRVIGIQTAARHERDASFSGPQLRIARGIAQLASTALANAQLVAELEAANRLKSEFVSTMSHELRTPLNVILGFVEMARDPEFAEAERQELLGRIGAAGRDLLDLIEETLTAGKIEAGRDEARIQDVELAALWRDVGEACARLPRDARVVLHWDDAMPVARVRTDPDKLKVILRNLVGNALKFTEEGSVRASLARDDGFLVMRVADTGIGIRSDDQAAIFEMFRQADGSDTRRFGGTGLGLYIVRRFVTQLGGTISVNSAPGSGSLFEVRLPLAHEPA